MSLLLLVTLGIQQPTTLLVPPFSHTMGFNRVTRFYLQLYLGRSFKADNPQGMCGAKMAEEDDPKTGKDDHILTLFAVNSGTSQIVYNVRLVQPKIYGAVGSGPGQFREPHGICCNPQGDVYVADTGNDRVVRLRYANTELSWVGVLDSNLAAPTDVCLDSRGRVYVADTGNDRIVVYSPAGQIEASWTGVLDRPTAIAVIDTGAAFNDFEEELAVAVDHDRTRVNELDLAGQLLRQVDMRRLGLDQAGFSYCAFDRHGNVYVTDQVNSQIHLFDPNLKYIVSHGRPGDFDSPRGIVIWPRFGQLFVNEAEGGQYYWIGLDGYLIGCYPEHFNSSRPGTTIALYVTELADVSVDIADSTGKLVRTLTPPHFQRPGEALIVWDGNDNSGRLVPPGSYRIKATIRPTYSRPKFIHKKELTGTVRRLPDP